MFTLQRVLSGTRKTSPDRARLRTGTRGPGTCLTPAGIQVRTTLTLLNHVPKSADKKQGICRKLGGNSQSELANGELLSELAYGKQFADDRRQSTWKPQYPYCRETIEAGETIVFSGEQIRGLLDDMQFTHVVWLPDSTLGQWESELRDQPERPLITVCREGEAWAIAAGLHLGGARPLVMIQCTGLFESGDAMRNAIHDYGLPLSALIGYRSYLSDATLPGDTARKYAEPILRAWDLDYLLVTSPDQLPQITTHYQSCQSKHEPGIVLLAEGKA